jgi:D-sedoheptulose 7-phosphate isomerase
MTDDAGDAGGSRERAHRDLRTKGVARLHLEASARLKLVCAETLAESAAIDLLSVLRRGKKILVCGNGGSAADAQHLASELTGRFVRHRRALPAIALTTDTSALTAISNDYGYETVFARQVEALAAPGDVLVAISTSGASASILRAAEAARQAQCTVIGLSGRTGGQLALLCHRCIIVPANDTALIQEVHESIIHAWGTVIEDWYLDNDETT